MTCYDKINASKWKNKFWTKHPRQKNLQICCSKLIRTA